MNTLKTVTALAVAVLGTGVLATVAMAAPAASPSYHWLTGNPNGTYKIDPQHTEVLFTLGHVGIAPFTGRFDKISGTYTFDNKDPQKDQVHITIPAASIDTDFALRDEHLRSKLFFDVKKYPEVTFVSTKYQPTGKDTGKLFGNLTLHGVTKPVVFQVHIGGAGKVAYLPKPWGGYLSGFVASTNIKRSDYGMTAYLPEGLSNTIHIKVEVEGIRQPG